MKRFLLILMMAAVACFGVACGDDDDDNGGTDTTDMMEVEDDVEEDTGGDTEDDTGDTEDDAGDTEDDTGDTGDDTGDTEDDTSDMEEDMASLGDFTLNLTGFDPHVDQMVAVAVIDESDSSEVYAETMDSLASAAESFTATGVIEADGTYTVNFFADVNGNMTCDAPTDDHVWSLTGQTPDANGDLIIDFAHDTEWTDVCDTLP